jgi:hypothetical protein
MAFAMVLVPFIPASNVFVVVGFAVAERVMYTPSMGACILYGYLIQHLTTSIFVPPISSTPASKAKASSTPASKAKAEDAKTESKKSDGKKSETRGDDEPKSELTRGTSSELTRGTSSTAPFWYAAVAAYVAFAVGQSSQRSLEWRDSRSLMCSGVQVHPSNARLNRGCADSVLKEALDVHRQKAVRHIDRLIDRLDARI